MIVEEKAFAKINLSLEILSKRKDGYHDILSTMASVKMHDLLKLKQIKEIHGQVDINLNVSGDYKSVVDEIDIKDNIIFKAVKNYCEMGNLGIKADIDLVKNIPSGAGLGGGSADAAAVLRILNKRYQLFSNEQLNSLAAGVGADVPFCLVNGVAICEGIGEFISPVDAELDYFIVIANNGIHVNTGQAYDMIDDHLPESVDISTKKMKLIACLNKGILDGNCQCFINDFERVVFNRYDSIEKLKETFIKNGADFSLMSGSGSSVYGLFSDQTKARAVYEKLKAECKSVFLTEFKKKIEA